jgi:translation elongation factor EF-Tu-like GTPase
MIDASKPTAEADAAATMANSTVPHTVSINAICVGHIDGGKTTLAVMLKTE